VFSSRTSKEVKDLILIYDSNSITIEGDTSIAWSESVKLRFEAQGWRVLEIDGHNFEEIDKALYSAKSSDRTNVNLLQDTKNRVRGGFRSLGRGS